MPERVPACYHCTTQCVRDLQLLLDDEGEDSIRPLVLARLQHIARYFAIDVMSYAIMHRRYDLVIFVSPGRVDQWSDHEVAERWLMLYPGHRRAVVEPPSAAQIAEIVDDPKRVAELRRRLCDPSWFFKALNEWVARRVNDIRGSPGRVWDKRFGSRRLLDITARVAACVHCDLAAVRAKMARTPEQSQFTSVRERAAALRTGGDESVLWLSPISPSRGTPLRPSVATFEPQQYVTLVDATARRDRDGELGRIDHASPPILEGLGVDTEAWQREMLTPRREQRIFGTAVGAAASRARESIRRKVKWIVRVLDVYVHDQVPPPDPWLTA